MKQMLIPLLFIIILYSCSEEPDPHNCPTDIVCTKIFAMVTTQVKDQAGSNVELDSALVTNMSTDKTRHSEYHDLGGTYSYYVIATDSDKDEIAFEGTTFLFEGWIKGQQVLETTFVVG
ncbi:hypothetical protein [Marinoscillum sp. MHG1-6]|uniref:hypothetical protein n=1 Tax=Marinoscillum sp. MHG1-6 TaxID=2959627 RepID=UPI0021587518|nr:hypothetical protein [Marinoscillum sp. MHG1-6]